MITRRQQNKTITITILAPTAIKTYKGESQLHVFPNPFASELTILVSGLPAHSTAELKLIDFLGKEHRSQKWNASQKIERGDLPAGMYFIELREQGRVLTTTKIVICD